MNKLVSVGLACFFSFGLFVLMTFLIETDVNAKGGDPTSIDLGEIPKELDLTPIPPIKKNDPPKAPELVKTPDLSMQKKLPETPKLPKVAFLKPTMGGIDNPTFLVGGDPGNDRGNQLNDLSLVPKIRIEPQYPTDAAYKGIQGFVTLRFDVDENGQTTNIEVIESTPKGYFEKESKKALMKWKYSAKKEAGVAVASLNQVVTLEFKLEGN